MTKLDEELERLSKAAEQGLITILPGANSHCFDGRLMLGNKCIAFVEGDQTQDEDGEYQIVLDPEALLIVELWNAYRTGQLVPAQPSGGVVEAVARGICNAIVDQDDPGFQAPQDWEGTLSYLDQGETDFLVAARAAITTYEAVSGVAKMRDALVDDPNWIAAGIPDEAVEAGIAAWDAATADMESPSPKKDWDEGMIVAAIFKAVARAALGEKP